MTDDAVSVIKLAERVRKEIPAELDMTVEHIVESFKELKERIDKVERYKEFSIHVEHYIVSTSLTARSARIRTWLIYYHR